MTIKTIEDVLFPGIGVRVGKVEESSGKLVVEAVSIGRPGRCPDCRSSAMRVHSSYHRRLVERPLGPRHVVVRLKVRRFFCDRRSCPRRTFAEQVAGFTERHGRISVGLKQRLYAVAVELGGRPGARLCRKVQMKAGRTLLLGLLQAPPVPARAPRVLGVDDFALRRRTRYATVLVDVEASRVVDVLSDRTAEVLADWLAQHPGAEVICRDRASAYSKAIRQAAPHALEVADRWHLLQNLSNALEKTCHQHRSCLRKHAEQEARPSPPKIEPLQDLPRTAMVERTRHRYEDIHRLLDEGRTVNGIARDLDLDPRTVDKYKKTPLDDLLASAANRRPNTGISPFKPYLHLRLGQLGNKAVGAHLHRELRERGFRGHVRTVERYLARFSIGEAETVHAPMPSPSTVAAWVTRHRELLTEEEEDQLLRVRLACPDITRACDLTWAFLDITRNLRGTLLLEWIHQAVQDAPKPMRGFANGLLQDLDAVTAGLTLPWSSGIVEGHVNRIKTLKRAMYGRASFKLLRTRILTHP
ncbi:ISL3 family transposase [Streptomyces olivoreticuli]|nr:ISL3 family transposase [Streptomyces olivoreticuli]WKK25068.1 ISL3 family transposase [Streptomyces olivoreticuli]WKK25182.1 ISL3 family transposase [Streptomyces olivoreticuli]WKK25276.1 ISL3 family transposase [Streptomyces olivoreticuli]WKK27051.1 ISL3 family transposase [Streptomyces olivoreticuli]WKK27290.1 ISL3 family transposase [Streptomyces olivoreticuli]